MEKYKGWHYLKQLREQGEIDIYTKTELREIGLKPKSDAIAQVHEVLTDHHYKPFNFYTIEQCVEIKRRKVVINDLEMTQDNLCKSLYVINKSAKISRDTKKSAYLDGQHGTVKRSKTREINLYDLKNKAMNKMIEDGYLELIGYHEQKFINQWGLEDINYLLLYKGSVFTFHIPLTHCPQCNVKKIGEIDMVSSERVDVGINFNDAKRLLEKYVEG